MWKRLWVRLRKALLKRDQHERDIDDEIRFHLSEEARLRAERGEPASEVERTARRAFGNVALTKAEVREVWAWRTLDTLRQDVGYGLRSVRRDPGFSAVAVLTLALGIGSGAAAFSVVNGVLIEPLPYANPDELVRVQRTIPDLGMDGTSTPLAVILDYRDRSRTLAGLAGEDSRGTATLIQEGPPETVRFSRVTPGYFELLGIRPELGRLLPPEEFLADGTKPAMLSYGYWQERYGGSGEVLGQTLRLEGEPVMTVVGILPPGFQTADFTGQPNPVWTTASMEDVALRRAGSYLTVGRLQPGATIQAAQTEMETIAASMAEEFPDTDRAFGDARYSASVRPLKVAIVGDFRSLTLTFSGAVGMVLLISILNLVSLQASRISKRQREFSIRAALGASRWPLMRQAVIEAAVLSLPGTALALAVASPAREMVLANTPPLLPRMNDIAIDGSVVAFGGAAALVSALVVGILPVLRVSQPDLEDALKDGSRAITDSPYQRRLRGAVTTAETAMAIVLLLGAVLLIQSFSRLISQELGFDPRNVVTARVALTERYSDTAARNALFGTLVDEVQRLPGVEAVSAANGLPFEGGTISGVSAEGGTRSVASMYTVSESFGSVLHIAPRTGRWFSAEEVDRGVPVAVVSESAARSMWPGQNPIGRRVRRLAEASWLTVVGVVPDVRNNLTQEAGAAVYAPYSTDFLPESSYRSHGMVLGVRLAGGAIPPLGDLVRDIEPASTVTVNSLSSLIRGRVASEQFRTTLLSAFAAAAVILAMLAVAGVVAFSTARRTREIGLRMALGATPRGVVRQMMREGVVPAAAGLAIGLVLSTMLTQFLESYLFGVEPSEPSAYAIVFVVGLALVMLASWFPARQAAHIDPMAALRSE